MNLIREYSNDESQAFDINPAILDATSLEFKDAQDFIMTEIEEVLHLHLVAKEVDAITSSSTEDMINPSEY